MRYFFIALAVLATTPAIADDFRNQIDGRHQRRAFWLNDQAWPITRPDSGNKPPPPKFTKTYMDGLVSRFRVGASGHFDLFERKVGEGFGIPAPALVGTFDHGAAMVEMRWNPGQ